MSILDRRLTSWTQATHSCSRFSDKSFCVQVSFSRSKAWRGTASRCSRRINNCGLAPSTPGAQVLGRPAQAVPLCLLEEQGGGDEAVEDPVGKVQLSRQILVPPVAVQLAEGLALPPA